MVNSCVAAGCNKTTRDGVHLFSFPKDLQLRKKWVDQVRRTRDKWEPTEHSRLCSCHFEESCFEVRSRLAETLDLGKTKVMLKRDAVPTLFDRSMPSKRQASSTLPAQPNEKRTAFEKRERARVRIVVSNFLSIGYSTYFIDCERFISCTRYRWYRNSL